MMGIGFTEMVVIAGIALVVIGPEKFPDFAKLVIRTIRDLRGYVDEVKAEVGKELKPLKKEMDALSRIDPEKYIDSLTAEVPEKKAVTPANPSINEEDRKVMSAADAEAYGEDPYSWGGGETSAAAPEGTVGYGSTGDQASEHVGVEESDGAEAAVDGAHTSEPDDRGAPNPVGEIDPDFEDFGSHTDPNTTNAGEPDPWTGR